jgi:hypothetical protein
MNSPGFVADGWNRARTAVEAAARINVQQRYAVKIEAATPAERTSLQAELEREIARRVAEQAPRWALY